MGPESPAEHLRNALQILAPMLAEYAQHGDDPAVLVSLEDVGYLVECAARRIRYAIDQLEQRDGPACPVCTAHHTPSVMITDRGVLRCIWCGHEQPRELAPLVGRLELSAGAHATSLTLESGADL